MGQGQREGLGRLQACVAVGGLQSSTSGSQGAKITLKIKPAKRLCELLWLIGAPLARSMICPQYSKETKVIIGALRKHIVPLRGPEDATND